MILVFSLSQIIIKVCCVLAKLIYNFYNKLFSRLANFITEVNYSKGSLSSDNSHEQATEYLILYQDYFVSNDQFDTCR